MAEPRAAEVPVRLVVISTPRSGNTWLRRILATAYDLAEEAVLEPSDLDWSALPQRCAVQIHWQPTDAFRETLARNGFRVITLARHPLDVFLSTLNFVYHAHARAGCAAGPDCPTCVLVGAAPTSRAFLDFCCGEHGRDMLSMTLAWWDRPGVIRVRYEDLVRDTPAEVARILAEIGVAPDVPPAEAIAANSMDNLRRYYSETSYHFWQGRPDHWRTLLPAGVARAIAAAHPAAFATFGYRCDPDESLELADARRRWHEVHLQGVAVRHGPECVAHEGARRALCDAWDHLAGAVDALAAARAAGLLSGDGLHDNGMRHPGSNPGLFHATRLVRFDGPAREPARMMASYLRRQGGRVRRWLSA